MAKWSPKDKDDVADYWFDWTGFLQLDETIVTATVSVPDGLLKMVDDHTDKTVRVRLSGGDDGELYDIGCLITTSAGETFDVTKTLKIQERIK
jgi:hypothetical protein